MYEATEQRDLLLTDLKNILQLLRAVRDRQITRDCDEVLRGIIHAAGTVRIVEAYKELEEV